MLVTLGQARLSQSLACLVSVSALYCAQARCASWDVVLWPGMKTLGPVWGPSKGHGTSTSSFTRDAPSEQGWAFPTLEWFACVDASALTVVLFLPTLCWFYFVLSVLKCTSLCSDWLYLNELCNYSWMGWEKNEKWVSSCFWVRFGRVLLLAL